MAERWLYRASIERNTVKSLGITFAFFGIVATVAAIADLNSGRYDLHNVLQATRGGLWVMLGMSLVAIGMILVKQDQVQKKQ
jgi:hypothetical protein